jgi:glutamate formiminotransferase
MIPVMQAVPNFSEGRDAGVHRALVEAVERTGAELLDWSADFDHHRCVLTYVGTPGEVEDASVAAARVALEAIDLRRHRGVHPRIGAMDVLPFVPLQGLSMDDAVGSALRAAHRLAELGIPVYLYREAARPRGRGLAELRRGGYEALVSGFPEGRVPDLLPGGWTHPGIHPTAGATCVGARPLLLAWNVEVKGMRRDRLREIAGRLREAGGGIAGLRTLALELPREGALQLSMNLEDPGRVSPFAVYRAVEAEVVAAGGELGETEVVGLMPEALVLPSAADRLRLRDAAAGRLLPVRLGGHISARVEREVGRLLEAVEAAGPGVPDEVLSAVHRLERTLRG